MKNTTANKIISIVVLLVLCCATVAGAYLGIFGRVTEYATIREDGADVQRALYRQVAYIPNTINQTWKEAFTPSAALGGGYAYHITADGTDSTTLKKVANALKDRVVLVTGNASTAVKDGEVVLTVPEDGYNSLIANLISVVGDISFAVYDSGTGELGEAVMTGEHVKQAYYSTSNSAYATQVVFNSKGLKVIDSLLSSASYGSYLYLLLDGQPLSYVYLTTPSNDMLAFSANDWTSAFVATACLRSGSLPAAASLASYNAAEATMGGFLNGIVIGVAIALLLVCVYLIARAGLNGLYGVWTLVAYIVLFFLLAALVAVSVSWRMDTLSLIVLVLCVAAFVYGLVSLFEQIAKAVRSGRGILPAYNAVSRKNLKLLAIVYGAMLCIGLLLMFIFQSGMYGVLGRMVALSAIVSFVMLYIFTRVIIHCCTSLNGKK